MRGREGSGGLTGSREGGSQDDQRGEEGTGRRGSIRPRDGFISPKVVKGPPGKKVDNGQSQNKHQEGQCLP